MPVHRVTSAASGLITSGKAAGKSSRQIAADIFDQFGIRLDQRTISRHVKAIDGKYQKRADEQPRTSKAPKAKATPAKHATRRQDEPADETEDLDEVTELRRQARQLAGLLKGDLTPKDRAALNAELRQTFASIRKADVARRQAETGGNADTAWVVAKLRRFDAMNRGETEAPAVNDDGELPEAARAADGE